jgi:uncharacterized membrane protein
MTLSPIVAVHMTAALGAIATGPVALWARKGAQQRPRLHRAFGYAWVTLMLVAATSAIFIPARKFPLLFGFGPIHLLVLVTYSMLVLAFWFLARGKVRGHRLTMTGLYIGACLVAGAFTLMPDRAVGQFVWGGLGLL